MKLVVWALSLNFLHVFTLFVIDIHKIMLISLFPTPFGHFQFLGSAGQNPNLILTLCLNVLGHFFIWSIDIIHLPFLVTVLGFSLYIEWSRLYGWFDCLGSIEDNCLLFEISLILLIHDSHFTKYSEEYKICTSLSLNILYDVKGSGKIWKNCKISSQNILDNGKK